jgi:tRNA(Ile)-lysidine synthase
MMTKARLALRQALKSLNPGDRVLVAVSGGADSLLLAHCLNLEGESTALHISAVIVDHQLQERSGDIALQTKKKLLEMGIPEVHVIEVEIVKKDGLEADARTARYEALTECAAKERATAICLGQNQDDLAESVLLGLTQGSGTKSLAGMTKQAGLYFRPFLSLSREEIVEACAEAHIEYWNDPHNEDERFTRVKIRKQILPLMESQLGPGIKEALARSARIFREDSDALDTLTEEIFATIADPGSIEVELLERLPVALRKRVIRRALARLGATRISAEHLDWVEALIGQWHGQGAVALPAGVTARRESGRLALSRE